MARLYSNTKEPYPEKGRLPVKECNGESPVCLFRFIVSRENIDHPEHEQPWCFECLKYYNLLDESYEIKKGRDVDNHSLQQN